MSSVSARALPGTALALVQHIRVVGEPALGAFTPVRVWCCPAPLDVAPSPCFDPHRGAGAQPCLAEPAATQSSGHSTQCPKRKNPWVTEDDVCLHKDSAHPLDPELSRGIRILLPGNSIPAPSEEQCHCSHTNPGERLQAALLFIFSPLFLISAPSSGCCTGRNLVPALDWLPGACGILVCVGLALLACLSLSSSFFPRNKISSFLQPIKLLVLRKQERWLLMSKRCRTQPFGSAGAAKRKPGMSGCKRKEKGSRGWGWCSPQSYSATAGALPGSDCMWGITPGTGGAEQPQPGSEI